MIMIQHCNQQTMAEALRMRGKGLTVANIAARLSISYNTLRRYFRVFDQYGIEVFKP